MYCPNCAIWSESGPTETWPNHTFHCGQCGKVYDVVLKEPVTVRHLIALVKNNKKIEAIKQLRGDTGLGLRESKNIIDILGDVFTPATPRHDL